MTPLAKAGSLIHSLVSWPEVEEVDYVHTANVFLIHGVVEEIARISQQSSFNYAL